MKTLRARSSISIYYKLHTHDGTCFVHYMGISLSLLFSLEVLSTVLQSFIKYLSCHIYFCPKNTHLRGPAGFINIPFVC